MYELIIDNFAGGGGASTGIEMAIGRSIDIAINHDPAAILMHKTNHPNAKHYCESVWEVDPLEATGGKPVGLAWFSPDCKHFSKAKGGKPVDKNIRGLAWVAVKWAKLVKPRVIMLENVEEFKSWGPLKSDENGNLHPDPNKKGQTFELFVKSLEELGYEVSFKELRACDYGAPTIRKRFFMIARCDGKLIVWPEPTHGDPKSLEVQRGIKKPWKAAADIIDWSLPCPSIFDTSQNIKEVYGLRAVRPLADKTMKRIARGIQKFIIDNPDPFIVKVNHSGADWHYLRDIGEPLHTLTAKNGAAIVTPVISAIGHTGFTDDRSYSPSEPVRTIVSKSEQIVIAPTMIQYHTENTEESTRGQIVDKPIMTIDSSPRYALVSAFVSKYYSGGYNGAGSKIIDPVGTVNSIDHNALVTAFISRQFGTSTGHELTKPSATVTAVNKSNLVQAFLIKYYGKGTGQNLDEPLGTVVSKDRFGIVTIKGVDYKIVDIGMRMLEPHELFAAQGFPDDYVIDRDYTGKKYPKTAQVARCGNAVPPPLAKSLVESNLPELCRKEEIAI